MMQSKLKWPLKAVLGLLCLILTGLPGGAGAAEPERLPLSAAETQAFAHAEEQALTQTNWGAGLAAFEQLKLAIPRALAADAREIAWLESNACDELAGVVGLGEEMSDDTLDRIILFLPDRIFDFLDMFTGSFGIGLGAGIEGHISRYFGLGLGVELSANGAWLYNRNLSIYFGFDTWGSLGPLIAYLTEIRGAGFAWSHGEPEDIGAHSFVYAGPFDHYDNEMVECGWIDPWGIGYRFSWGFFMHSLEAHPIEIADFVAGFCTLGLIDISMDDWANPDQVRFKRGLPEDVPFAVEDGAESGGE